MDQPPPVPPQPASEVLPAPEQPRRLNWVLFLTALFLPTLVTVLSAKAYEGLAVAATTLGGVGSGIVCGILLGRWLGKTETSRVFLSLGLVAVMSVVCVTMNFFGCMAAGFKFNVH